METLNTREFWQAVYAGRTNFDHCDLSGVNLEEHRGHYVDGVEYNYKAQQFSGFSFASAVFLQSDETYDGHDAYKCDFDGADLSNVKARSMRGQQSSFRHANLRHADLSKGHFYGADFTGADLSYANLSERADFTAANFTDAKLIGANLHRAIFQGANFTGANLTCATVTLVILRNSARTKGLILDGAVLTDTILELSNLEGVSFKNADLRNVDLSGSNIRGADFRGAIIDKTTGLYHAFVDDSTQWPFTGLGLIGFKARRAFEDWTSFQWNLWASSVAKENAEEQKNVQERLDSIAWTERYKPQ